MPANKGVQAVSQAKNATSAGQKAVTFVRAAGTEVGKDLLNGALSTGVGYGATELTGNQELGMAAGVLSSFAFGAELDAIDESLNISGLNKPELNTYGDALRENLGPAYLSHPEEYNFILNEAKKMGVSVEFRKGTLAYDMELGKPGKLIIDPEASIGALRHEYRHMLDDFTLGHPGMRIIADSNKFWELEFRGYCEEFKLAMEIKDFEAGKFIINEMRQRRIEILGK